MSFWTYVSAEFTFDTHYLKENKKRVDEKLLDDIFGKTVRFQDMVEHTFDDIEKHPENYLPMGSEGSLKKSVWVKQTKTEKGGIAYKSKHVRVHGSLRDVWDAEPAKEWFKRVCNKPEISYGAIKIELDGGISPVIMVYEQLMDDDSDFREYIMLAKEDK